MVIRQGPNQGNQVVKVYYKDATCHNFTDSIPEAGERYDRILESCEHGKSCGHGKEFIMTARDCK